MSALERLLACVLVLVVIVAGGVIYANHYGAERYKAGYADAVAAGRLQHDHDAEQARQTETDLRAQLRAKDATAQQKDIEHAQALAAAQRRVLTGADRLRCPAASPVHEAAPTGDRPTAAESGTDGAGPTIVPETAADLLGIAGDVASLVSRYEQVVERFEACRAVNAK